MTAAIDRLTFIDRLPPSVPNWDPTYLLRGFTLEIGLRTRAAQFRKSTEWTKACCSALIVVRAGLSGSRVELDPTRRRPAAPNGLPRTRRGSGTRR